MADHIYYRTALYRDNAPLAMTNVASVDGFELAGIQPTGTDRRVAFSYQSKAELDATVSTQNTAASESETVMKYFKLTVDESGKATVSALEVQNITVDSVLSEGNTTAELAAVKSIPEWVGKTVYPVVAIKAEETATIVPTLKIGVKMTSANESYEYDEDSPIYKLSSNAVSIVSANANTETTGKASVAVTARLYNGGSWSDYMALSDVAAKKASLVQFKAHYAVTAIGSETAQVTGVTIVYNASMAKVSGSTAEIITRTLHFAEETSHTGVSFAQALIKHKKLQDAEIKAYAAFRTEPKTREMLSIGTGDGNQQTVALSDTNINHNSISVQLDGMPYYGFAYNTETNEVTFTAAKGVAVTASYEYGWEDESWQEMELVSRQVYDSDTGVYASRYQYTLPDADTDKTITAIKFVLERPDGDVTDTVLGTATGDTQVFKLPHAARKDTIICNGTWTYNDDTHVLTVIADKGTEIKLSYHWVAESHEVYGVTAGWAEKA